MGTGTFTQATYGKQQDPQAREQFLVEHLPLVRYIAGRLAIGLPNSVEMDDLVHSGVVGLIEAMDHFDPSRGIKFETYAYHRIRGAVMDMLRELDWLPRSVRQREAEMTGAYERLEGRLNRPPTDAELAGELGLTLEALDELAHEVGLQAMQSLDESVGSEQWEMGTVGELVADGETPSPQESADRWAERDLLACAIEALPEAERTVISLYYYEGLTLKEIGQVLGVTESRACQIHGKAMVRLRGAIQPMLKVPAAVEAAPAETHSAETASVTGRQRRG